MKKSILSLLCVASLSFAMNLEDGTKAFESKDYKTDDGEQREPTAFETFSIRRMEFASLG